MLQFSELENVYLTWVSTKNISKVKELENVTNKDIYFDESYFYTNGDPMHIPGFTKSSKFRIIDNKLEIDNRSFQSIKRKMSGDSRWKILTFIKELVKKYKNHYDIIRVVKKMLNICYCNDSKWKKALYEIIPERYFNDRGGIMSNSPLNPTTYICKPQTSMSTTLSKLYKKRQSDKLQGSNNTDIKIPPPAYDEKFKC